MWIFLEKFSSSIVEFQHIVVGNYVKLLLLKLWLKSNIVCVKDKNLFYMYNCTCIMKYRVRAHKPMVLVCRCFYICLMHS